LRIMLDFKCSVCDQVDERYIDNKTEYTECSKCNSRATRLVSTPTIALEGYSGSFPSAADAWAKKHNQPAKRD
jgi:DNA-directed RNA polymerase subunit RPC12/RpoP